MYLVNWSVVVGVVGGQVISVYDISMLIIMMTYFLVDNSLVAHHDTSSADIFSVDIFINILVVDVDMVLSVYDFSFLVVVVDMFAGSFYFLSFSTTIHEHGE